MIFLILIWTKRQKFYDKTPSSEFGVNLKMFSKTAHYCRKPLLEPLKLQTSLARCRPDRWSCCWTRSATRWFVSLCGNTSSASRWAASDSWRLRDSCWRRQTHPTRSPRYKARESGDSCRCRRLPRRLLPVYTRLVRILLFILFVHVVLTNSWYIFAMLKSII